MVEPEVQVIQPLVPGRRRRFTVEEKLKMVEESREPGSNMSLVARRYGIATSQLFQWRRLVEQGQISSVSAEEEVVPVSRVKELEKRVYELERALGRKSLENDVLKEAVCIGLKKTLVSRQPLVRVENFQ